MAAALSKSQASPLAALNADRENALALAKKVSKTDLKRLLDRAHRQLVHRLRTAHGLSGAGVDSFSTAQLRITLLQVRAIARELGVNMKDLLKDTAHDAAIDAAGGALKYMQAMEARYNGITERLPIKESLLFDRATRGAESSVLQRLQDHPESGPGIMNRYGEAVVKSFEETLQTRFVARTPWAEVRQQLIDASPFLQGKPASWAERIVRTEVMNVHGQASLDSAREAQNQLGDAVKILCATFDNRTGSDSIAVHGQIRRVEEAFAWWEGAYMSPPNRPNDREIVVTHRVSWPIPPELAPRSDSEVAARWALEGRKGSPPGRPKMTTVPRERFGNVAPPDTPTPQPQVPAPAPARVPPPAVLSPENAPSERRQQRPVFEMRQPAFQMPPAPKRRAEPIPPRVEARAEELVREATHGFQIGDYITPADDSGGAHRVVGFAPPDARGRERVYTVPWMSERNTSNRAIIASNFRRHALTDERLYRLQHQRAGTWDIEANAPVAGAPVPPRHAAARGPWPPLPAASAETNRLRDQLEESKRKTAEAKQAAEKAKEKAASAKQDLESAEAVRPKTSHEDFVAAGIQFLGSDSKAAHAKLQQEALHKFGKPLEVEQVRRLAGVDHVPKEKNGRKQKESIKVYAFGPEIGVIATVGPESDPLLKMQRTFTKTAKGVNVHHDLFILHDSLRGQGTMKKVFRDQFAEYEKLNVKSIDLTAAWSGRHVWPNMGFELSDPRDLGNIKTRMKGRHPQYAAAIDAAPDVQALVRLKDGEHEYAKEFLYGADNQWMVDYKLDMTPGNHNYELVKGYLNAAPKPKPDGGKKKLSSI